VNSRRLAHINYKALPYICKAITGLPELKGDHEGVCNGCAQGKNVKNPFSKRDSKAEGVLELIHSDVCGPMPSFFTGLELDFIGTHASVDRLFN
jgi:hypothetical protein